MVLFCFVFLRVWESMFFEAISESKSKSLRFFFFAPGRVGFGSSAGSLTFSRTRLQLLTLSCNKRSDNIAKKVDQNSAFYFTQRRQNLSVSLCVMFVALTTTTLNQTPARISVKNWVGFGIISCFRTLHNPGFYDSLSCFFRNNDCKSNLQLWRFWNFNVRNSG